MSLTQIVRGTMLALVVMAGTSGAVEIKIGAAEALTGNASQYGVPIRKGFELALSEINGSGGINGEKLALIFEDEQGKKEEAIKLQQKAIELAEGPQQANLKKVLESYKKDELPAAD